MHTELHEPYGLSYEYHHVVLRSREGQRLFSTKAQRAEFLKLVQRAQRRTGISILAYCLLTTETHFVVRVIRGTGVLSYFAGTLKKQYSRYVHKHAAAEATRGVQHLFVRHFSSRELQLPTVQECIQLLHQKAVGEQMAKDEDKYLWSSRRAYMLMKEIPWLHLGWALELNKPPHFPWPLPLTVTDTAELVKQLIEVVSDKVGMPSVEVYSRKRSRQATLVRAVVTCHAMRWGVTQENVIQLFRGDSPVALKSSTITAAINHYEVVAPKLFEMPTQELLAQVPHWRMR